MAASYVALIADVIASRQLSPARRAALQRDLRRVLPEWSRRWHSSLAARFAVTQGDEIECLLKHATAIWEIAHVLRTRFADVDWTVACGQGPVSTPLSRGITAPEVDGPCFHLARAAVADAKARRLLFAFAGFGERQPLLLGLASYYSALYWAWTPRQRTAAAWLRTGPPGDAARALRIDRSAVSHLARRMAWPLVRAGDAMFGAALGAP
ncbi:MAG TPA: SatD family protein [Gemmatimonadales bacterium]|nr:SatD family protein [Gemmatimonadales bacterium]